MAMDTTSTHQNELCFHGHQLHLVHSPATKSFTCKGCKERGSGHRYRCSKTCDFNLHKECFQPPLTLQHPHFPGHAFHFLPQPPTTTPPPRFCDACGKPVLRYDYHCRERGWDLHPCCTDLPRHIPFADGSKLTLQEDTNVIATGVDHGPPVVDGTSWNTKPCFRCKHSTLRGTIEAAPGWFYVSECGLHRCHVYCMMKSVREISSRLPAASRRRGIRRANRDESWWETLSLISTMTQFILGDPTGIIFDMLTG